MSGEPKPDEPTAATMEDAGASGVIPVEVEAPDQAHELPVPAPTAPAPTAPAPTAIELLEQKLAASDKDKKENWDRYLRAAADLENLRKRQRREVDDAKLDAKFRVLKEILPVVDNLERAIEHAGDNAAAQPIVEGVQLVLRQLVTAFERLDISQIDALNQPFDPNLHEAISQQESDAAPGSVVQVLQRGYRSGDRLLRPALVVVAKPKAHPPEPDQGQ